MEILKVSSKSDAKSVAGAIAGIIRESNNVEIQAVGAGAINQAIKAIAVARGFLAPSDIDIFCTPSFATVDISGNIRTAIKLLVEKR